MFQPRRWVQSLCFWKKRRKLKSTVTWRWSKVTMAISSTLWLFNIAMENSPVIDDFPIKTSIYKGFSMAMLNNQMVIKYICTQAACYLITYLVFQIPGGSSAWMFFPPFLSVLYPSVLVLSRQWENDLLYHWFSNRCLTARKGSRGRQLWNLTSWYELLLSGELPTNRK